MALASCVLFSSMGASIKLLGTSLPSHEAAFFRSLFGMLVILPFVLRLGAAGFATNRLPLHASRGVTGGIAMLCGFYSVTHLPLATSAALSFTKPLFLIPLAALFLAEPVRLRRTLATAAGFLGVLVILRPGQVPFDPTLLVALAGAMTLAVVNVQVKMLAATENPATLILYANLFATLTTCVPAMLVWRAPTLDELGLLVAIGALAAGGQSLWIRAMALVDATAITPYDYGRMVLSTGFGYWLFGELPDGWTMIGAAIIIGSTLYIAHREAQLGKKPVSGPTPPEAG